MFAQIKPTSCAFIESKLTDAGFYRNPGVKQSRSARFGHKRTEKDALDIVLKWMWSRHEEAVARNEWLA